MSSMSGMNVVTLLKTSYHILYLYDHVWYGNFLSFEGKFGKIKLN